MLRAQVKSLLILVLSFIGPVLSQVPPNLHPLSQLKATSHFPLQSQVHYRQTLPLCGMNLVQTQQIHGAGIVWDRKGIVPALRDLYAC